MSTEIKTQVVVLGAGPAGYSAAFRCADLGLETVIVERYNTLGGVCLNVGCIPSKALLHVAKVIEEAKALAEHGIVFGEPKTDIDKIRTWKEKVITQLTGGLAGMAKGRKVKVVNGLGKFTGANTLEVEGENGKTVINFDNAIIAAGSRPIQLPFIPHEDPRVWDSTDALELKEVPKRMLVMAAVSSVWKWVPYTTRWVQRLTWLKCSIRLSRRLIKISLKSSPSASARNST